MGIYSTGSIINENYLEDIDVQESAYEPGFEGALQNILDEEVNYSRLMEAVAIAELSHFEQTGRELVYEGANLSGFFGKLKEFFKNMYEKIKGLFKKFIGFIDSLIMNDKAFVNKYRATLLAVVTKDFEYKGFDFSDLTKFDLAGGLAAAKKIHKFDRVPTAGDIKAGDATKFDNEAKAWRTDKENLLDQMRGAVAGAGKKIDESDFHKIIFEKLRGGKNKPETITTVDANKELNIISSFKENKAKAEEDFNALEKGINEIIKNLSDAEKEISRALSEKDNKLDAARSAAIRYMAAYSEAEKARLGYGQKAQGIVMSAMKQQYRQAKAICVKLINYKPKNESVDLSGGLFGDIVFQ